MLECEITSLQQAEHHRHIERRLRIASRATNDRPLVIKHEAGITGYQAEQKRQEAIAAAKEAIRQAKSTISEIEAAFPDVDFLLPECSRMDKWPTWFINRIKKTVAKEFGVTINDLDAGRRIKQHVAPRFTAIYLCKTLTLRSLPSLGRSFGDRDHTTILHAIKKTEERMKSDPFLCQQVAELQDRLERDLAEWRAHV